jgi:hypothetical protein
MFLSGAGSAEALTGRRRSGRGAMSQPLGLLAVIVAVLALSACGANKNGGTHQLGAQQRVGSVTAGGCIDTGSTGAHTYYCGQQARQWCQQHPGTQPQAGSCAGVQGWHGPTAQTTTTTGGSGSSTSGANTGTSTTGSAAHGSTSSQTTASQSGSSLKRAYTTPYSGNTGSTPTGSASASSAGLAAPGGTTSTTSTTSTTPSTSSHTETGTAAH